MIHDSIWLTIQNFNKTIHDSIRDLTTMPMGKTIGEITMWKT